MKVEWTCCFCDKEEFYIVPENNEDTSKDIGSEEATSDNADGEAANYWHDDPEDYWYCTCCEKESTWFHADKSVCLRHLRFLYQTETSQEAKETAETKAAVVQRAHERAVVGSNSTGDFFFYNCDECSSRECFGCKKASLTRAEPHAIGTLRASLCAVCRKRASCSRAYKEKDYTKGVDFDLYLCSAACRQQYLLGDYKDADDGEGGEGGERGETSKKRKKPKARTLTEGQWKKLERAIEKYLRDADELTQARAASRQKWLSYFDKRVTDGGEALVPTDAARTALARVIPKNLHFKSLWASKHGRAYLREGISEQEKSTRGKLFVDEIAEAVEMFVDNLVLENKDDDDVELFSNAATFMKNAVDNLREPNASLDELLPLTDDDAVGIGGANILEYLKSVYTTKAQATQTDNGDVYEQNARADYEEEVETWKAEAKSIQTFSADARDSLFKQLMHRVNSAIKGDIEGSDETYVAADHKSADTALTKIADSYSFWVLNKPVWPIVKLRPIGETPLCVRVNFWQWVWYNQSRKLGDQAAESKMFDALTETLGKTLSQKSDSSIAEPDPETKAETKAEADANTDVDGVASVAAFKSFYESVAADWRAKHFALDDATAAETSAMDGVPTDWLNLATVDSSPETKSAVGDSTFVSKQFKACVDALSAKFGTSVVPSDFDWVRSAFPPEVPFDRFALEESSERADEAIAVLVDALKPKLIECLLSLKAAYEIAYTAKGEELRAVYREQQAKLSAEMTKAREQFDDVDKTLRSKAMQNGGQSTFEFIMDRDKWYDAVAKYVVSTASEDKKTSVRRDMEKIRNAYKKGVAARKRNAAWAWAQRKFESMKASCASIARLSFKECARKALDAQAAAVHDKYVTLSKQMERDRSTHSERLGALSKDVSVVESKRIFSSAKAELREFLASKLRAAVAEFTKYYSVEGEGDDNDKDDVNAWFPVLFKASTSRKTKLFEEAKKDMDDAELDAEWLSKERLAAWEAALRNEADEDDNRLLRKEEDLCNKYFTANPSKRLQEEKEIILKAYGRHTAFHHVGHVSFEDCGEWAEKLGYAMTREVFVDWETRSLKKYMKYYNRRFDPSKAKDEKTRKQLKNVYQPKDAEEGRLIALRLIRDQAVIEWGALIRAFKRAWRASDENAMQKCRDAARSVFCTTKWMRSVRGNETTQRGLQDRLQDRWHYNDKATDSRKKQPAILEAAAWEEFAKDDAIFGVRKGDAKIRANPEGKLVSVKNVADIMRSFYCPQCGLVASPSFTVYDKPYAGFDFPDRNMYPEALRDNKNLQFCGLPDNYKADKRLHDRMRLHFAVNVALRDAYVSHLKAFTTCQYVTLGHMQFETLPRGGCLQAFTRKQAMKKLEKARERRAQTEHLQTHPWKRDAASWQAEVNSLQSVEAMESRPKLFRVDVRDPLWKDKTVRAPPGYRLVQYPGEGWTWQLEPYFDPLQTEMLEVKDDLMLWEPKQPAGSYATEELLRLSELCTPVGVVQNILSKLTAEQCGVGATLRREGAEQFVRGDKPYAWTLPVAPAIDADEDNNLNNVVGENARKARAQLQYLNGDVQDNMWMPEGYEMLEWYVESESNPELTRRLALRRNTFLAQQKIIMHRCRTELSGSLLRRQKKKLTSLHKKKLEDFVSEKIESMRKSARLHRAYKHRVRPNRTAAAAPIQEVKAWMISVLTDTPLRMYECKRSGKPCIYVDTEENNTTCESIAACAQAGPPENTADFVTKQQFDLETNKDVLGNLRFLRDNGVTVDSISPFNAVLDELGRELSDKESPPNEGDEGDEDDEGDEGDEDDEDENLEMQMQRREEDMTEDMRKDGWTYSSALEQYHRKKQEDRDEIYTEFQPVKGADGKYYAVEEQELIADAEDTAAIAENAEIAEHAETSESSEMELSGSEEDELSD